MINDRVSAVRRALLRPGPETSDHDLNPDTVLPDRRVLKPAAVLVLMTPGPDDMHLVLTKRSSRLKHHPGQIAFAGGKVDKTDEGPVDTALREAEEEIGLPRGRVEVLGAWSSHETVTGFLVTPVFGLIRDGFDPVAEVGEVDEIFSIPFGHIAEPANFRIEGRHWRGVWRRYYAIPYGPYYIWGATARILRAIAGRIEA
ncbi:MAG: CoA pyrophosphatase [Rhodobacteraceae bacterium]|nr:CoA pyrophosphatase [Paracoccaceae bacterium]